MLNVYHRDETGKWLRNFTGHLYVIEGQISAGKTTLGTSLEAFFKKHNVPCIFFPEYKNNTLLDHYIKHMKTEAFAFQTLMLRERFHIHERAIEYMNKGYAVFMDRGLIGDLAFALMQIDKGFFTGEQVQVYIDLLEEGSDNPFMKAEPTQTIFLQITHEEAFKRLHTRNNKAEVDAYDISYFRSLEEAYKTATKKVNTDVTYIDWSLDKKVNNRNMLEDDELTAFLREIQNSKKN